MLATQQLLPAWVRRKRRIHFPQKLSNVMKLRKIMSSENIIQSERLVHIPVDEWILRLSSKQPIALSLIGFAYKRINGPFERASSYPFPFSIDDALRPSVHPELSELFNHHPNAEDDVVCGDGDVWTSVSSLLISISRPFNSGSKLFWFVERRTHFESEHCNVFVLLSLSFYFSFSQFSRERWKGKENKIERRS